MNNITEMLKGVLEGIVLEIMNNKEVYGYEIVKKLKELGFDNIAEGTIYSLLIRLEKNNLVTINKMPSEIGPPRKFYSLNEYGIKSLDDFWKNWDFLGGTIEILRNGE